MIEAVHDHWLLIVNLVARLYLVEYNMSLRDMQLLLLLLLISSFEVRLLRTLLQLHLKNLVFQYLVRRYVIVITKNLAGFDSRI
jgi:hypothetical protein